MGLNTRVIKVDWEEIDHFDVSRKFRISVHSGREIFQGEGVVTSLPRENEEGPVSEDRVLTGLTTYG